MRTNVRGAKDGKEKRLCLNLNEEQFGILKESSEVLGVSMCQFIRMYLNTLLYAKRSAVKAGETMKRGDGQLANEKSLAEPDKLR